MRRLTLPVALVFLSACAERAPVYELAGSTMGTRFSVQVAEPMPQHLREDLQRDITAALEEVEQAMSTYRPASALASFNRARSTEWIPVPASLCRAVEIAESVSRLSGGAFDVTVGPLVDLWGFGPQPERVEPPPAADIEAALARANWRLLHADCARPALKKDRPDLQIDLSAYGKGLGVDKLAGLLDAEGLENYLVEIGGELRLRGRGSDGDAWSVAIEAPSNERLEVQRVLHTPNGAVATSGDYRNFFEYGGQRFAHVIDPRTGWPVSHDLAAVTVIADSAAMADALATALLVLGPVEGPALARRENIAALFQRRVGERFEPGSSPAFEERAGSR